MVGRPDMGPGYPVRGREVIMPRASSADRRERVLADREAGLGRAAAARRCRIGERTVYRWLRAARHEGRRRAKPHAGGPRPAIAGTEDVVLHESRWPGANDATLAEQAGPYEARTGRKPSPSTPCRAFRRLGLPRERDLARGGTGSRGDPGRAGGAFAGRVAAIIDPKRLVSVDEAGVTTNMVRRHARAPRGQRAYGRRPRPGAGGG
jgi:transposase